MLNQEIFNILSTKLSFWNQLSDSQKELLIANAKSMSFSKGQSIHSGESECIGVVIVKQMCIRDRHNKDGLAPVSTPLCTS